MATSFTLNMNEDVLFKHPCTMNSKPGTLYLTTLRVTWIASSKSNSEYNILLPWTQITDDKYSKITNDNQKCMIRLKSMNGDTYVFTLTGVSSPKLREELERAKVAVKRGRRGEGPNLTKNEKVMNTADDPLLLGSNDNRSEGDRQESLLAADAELRHLYAELVNGGVISANEFWSSRSKMLSDYEGKYAATKKGMSSSLLSDVQHLEVSENGIPKIQLTPEAVVDIFQMYPHVLEEYNAKVPVEMSKDEFWVKYFQHEFFNRKYRSQDLTTTSAHLPKGSTPALIERNGREKLTNKVSDDFDLTQTYGDYHYAEKLDPEDAQFRPSAVSEKYKRKGILVMEQQYNPDGNQAKRTKFKSDWDAGESILRKANDDENDDIPLELGGLKMEHFNEIKQRGKMKDFFPEKNGSREEFYVSCIQNNHSPFPTNAHACDVLRQEQYKLYNVTEVARQAANMDSKGGSFQAAVSDAYASRSVGGGAIASEIERTRAMSVDATEVMQTTPELEQVTLAFHIVLSMRLISCVFVKI